MKDFLDKMRKINGGQEDDLMEIIERMEEIGRAHV